MAISFWSECGGGWVLQVEATVDRNWAYRALRWPWILEAKDYKPIRMGSVYMDRESAYLIVRHRVSTFILHDLVQLGFRFGQGGIERSVDA